MMAYLDPLFWWTGAAVWTLVVVLAVVCGLPDGKPHKGVTLLAFYGFGVAVWRMLPENKSIFEKLKACGYRFWHVHGPWHLGLSLPSWLARRLAARRKTAQPPTQERQGT